MLMIDSQCQRCRHYNREDVTCAAYPDGIPPEMFAGDIEAGTPPVDHRQPYPGDHGIRFEPLPGMRHPLEVIK